MPATNKKPEYNMSYTDKKCVLVHMERYSPHQNGRKQQSAQHEKKATEFLQAKVNVSASIFSSQSAIEHMKKHLGREKRRS